LKSKAIYFAFLVAAAFGCKTVADPDTPAGPGSGTENTGEPGPGAGGTGVEAVPPVAGTGGPEEEPDVPEEEPPGDSPLPEDEPPDQVLPGDAPFEPPRPVGCVTDVSPGLHEFPCGEIRYVVLVPTPCVTRACGMIVDVHGGYMDAEQENNNTNMRALGEQHGYIVVQPSAPGNYWNAARDDEPVSLFLDEMLQAFSVDRKRVHMTGFSQGGFMTWRFLCKRAELFASVAPGGAGYMGAAPPSSFFSILPTGCAFEGEELPAHEVPVLHMQGEHDVMVVPQMGRDMRDRVVAAWNMSGPERIAGDGTFERDRYTSQNGTVYEFLLHFYQTDANFYFVPIVGHCFPGSIDHAPQEPGQLMGYGCKGQNSFHWGEEAIAFFMAHPKP
jgi:pimeloyl-ACP methyl ester carboxylesterase